MQAHGTSWHHIVALSDAIFSKELGFPVPFATTISVPFLSAYIGASGQGGYMWLPSKPVPARQEKVKLLLEDFAAHTLANTKAEVR